MAVLLRPAYAGLLRLQCDSASRIMRGLYPALNWPYGAYFTRIIQFVLASLGSVKGQGCGEPVVP